MFSDAVSVWLDLDMPMLLLLSITFIIFASLDHFIRGQEATFTRVASEQCKFNYKSENDTGTKGNRYSMQGTTICCSPKMTQASMSINLSERKKNCCVEKGSVTVGGLRPCPGQMFFTHFEGNSEDIQVPSISLEGAFMPGPRSECASSSKTKSKAATVDAGGYRLISFAEKDKCVDKKKPWHIKFVGVAPGYRKFAYSWCCSQDIYSDYTLDPKSVCCGLSGAQSDRFTKGSNIMPNNPPCCRHRGNQQDVRPLCEPFIMNNPSKNSPYRTCPPISGLNQITTNLDEKVPLFGPYSYAFPEKVSTSTDLHSHSLCSKTRFATFKYFYSIENMYDRLTTKKGPGDPYGVCCSQENMFAYDGRKVAASCCIAFTSKSGDSSYKRINCFKEQSKSRVGAISFTFPACKENACSRGVLKSDKEFSIEYSVDSSSDPNLYGSESFFATKNTRVTAPVPIPAPASSWSTASTLLPSTEKWMKNHSSTCSWVPGAFCSKAAKTAKGWSSSLRTSWVKGKHLSSNKWVLRQGWMRLLVH